MMIWNIMQIVPRHTVGYNLLQDIVRANNEGDMTEMEGLKKQQYLLC